MNILLVEDDPLTARLMKKVLVRAGYSLDWVDNGKVGFERIRDGRYDLALVDFQLPEMDGLQIVEALKGLSKTSVVILSALEDISVAVQAMKLGAVDFVVKGADAAFLEFLPGTVSRVLGAVAQKKALDEQRARLKCIIDAIPDFIFFKDQALRYQGCNKKASEALNISAEQLVGKKAGDLFDDEVARESVVVDEIIRQDLKPRKVDRWMDLPDGRRLMEINRLPYFGSDQEFLGLITLARDTTERWQREENEKQRAEELHRINEELQLRNEEIKSRQKQMVMREKLASLGTITSGLAHEIRNPLNFMTNMASLSRELLGDVREILATEPLSDRARGELGALFDDLGNNMEIVERHGKKVERVVESASMLTGESASPKVDAHLNDLVDEYTDLICGAKIGEGLLVLKSYDATVETLACSAQEVGRVLINLLNNAVASVWLKRAQDPAFAPTITVYTRQHLDDVFISVKDNGVGIEAIHMDQVFNPFFSTKPEGEHNIGLGLAICHDIVAEHGGELNVTSTLGEGALFEVRLPRT